MNRTKLLLHQAFGSLLYTKREPPSMYSGGVKEGRTDKSSASPCPLRGMNRCLTSFCPPQSQGGTFWGRVISREKLSIKRRISASGISASSSSDSVLGKCWFSVGIGAKPPTKRRMARPEGSRACSDKPFEHSIPFKAQEFPDRKGGRDTLQSTQAQHG